MGKRVGTAFAISNLTNLDGSVYRTAHLSLDLSVYDSHMSITFGLHKGFQGFCSFVFENISTKQLVVCIWHHIPNEDPISTVMFQLDISSNPKTV